MVVAITIKGDKAVMAALDKASKEVHAAAKAAVDATALEIRGDIVKRYQSGPASGRTYRKSNPTRVHRASAPGEAPMSDTGRLAGSVSIQSTGMMSASIFTTVEYGAWLEFGTRHIAKRPAWVPAGLAAEPKFQKRLAAYIARAMK